MQNNFIYLLLFFVQFSFFSLFADNDSQTDTYVENEYVEENDTFIWLGPGWYSGVWFGSEADFNNYNHYHHEHGHHHGDHHQGHDHGDHHGDNHREHGHGGDHHGSGHRNQGGGHRSGGGGHRGK